MKYSLYSLCIGLLLAATACQEVVEIDLTDEAPKLVVDGLITDQPGPYYVTLSTTGDFYSLEPTPRVTDATVTIADNAGNSEQLVQDSETPGVYRTENFAGVIGRTYYLTIDYRGQTYQSESTMPTLTDIDSLQVRFVEESVLKDEGYYLYFYAQEPQNEKNFYRWLVYKNDSLFNDIGDLLIADDVLVQGEINGLELPYAFDIGDTVRLEMYSLTQAAYDYYLGFQNAFFNDGGLFSPPPVNPPSTISNGGVGVFRASAVRAREVIISGD